MRGVNDLDWEEIKNITAEGGRKVKEKMTAESKLSNMNLGLLLGVTFLLGIVIGFIWAPIKRGLYIAGADIKKRYRTREKTKRNENHIKRWIL